MSNPSEVKTEETTGSKLKKFVKEWAVLPITLLVTLFIFKVIISFGVVPTPSMEPTIHSGSLYVATRYTKPENFNRGDIILFNHFHSTYVKRVIGLPGDTVSFEDGNVYINGKRYEEDYLPAGTITDSTEGEYTVPEDCFFVLGDNRLYSYDSRLWEDPFVHYDDVEARGVWFVNIPWWSGRTE